MTRKINAGNHVGYRRSSINGTSLAEEVLQITDVPWSDLLIDARRCPPELLTSGFYNAFWQKIHETQPDRLEEAKAIAWELEYDFQRNKLEYMRTHFEPRQPASVQYL